MALPRHLHPVDSGLNPHVVIDKQNGKWKSIPLIYHRKSRYLSVSYLFK